jgi:hypothetical protein
MRYSRRDIGLARRCGAGAGTSAINRHRGCAERAKDAQWREREDGWQNIIKKFRDFVRKESAEEKGEREGGILTKIAVDTVQTILL